MVDVSLGTGLNIYRFLCGNAAKLLGAYFMHDAPEDVQPYKALFNCPLYFNADYNGLSYHSSILIQPIEQHSEKMHELMQAHLKELERQHPGDIRQQVALTIRAALHTGDTSIELVAASMNMSRRTLQKKLQDNGTNFRKVLDEVRGDVARTYLAESKVSMTRLADILAYSELSAFSRAFKRWFGVAPQRWHSNKI